MKRIEQIAAVIAAGLLLAGSPGAMAQAGVAIYTDHLVNGFADWSWGTRDWANPSPVNSGSYSASFSGTAWNVALSLNHSGFDSSPYASLSFWANGGAGGGQVLRVFAHVNGADGALTNLPALAANAWQHFSIPLSVLSADNKTNLERFTIQLTSFGATNTFYFDDVQLKPNPAPPMVHLNLNASQSLRTADSRWFGFNTAIWDTNLDTPQTITLLKEAGSTTLRFPGGSLSDEYHWAVNKSLDNTWTWTASFTNFIHVATNVGANTIITVNYGTGTPGEASNWVSYANNTRKLGFKYWEIGNENYGNWETDSNTYPHDPFTYAMRATNYFAQMKAADPTIKVGLVVVSGENSYSNLYSLNHPAINPRTGLTNYGWTPILLAALKNSGITPDFVVHHVYPEYTGQESDALLLQSAAGWAVDAADLRQQISDYFGPGGTNIELVCTENNSNAGSQGRQSTSLVNALYYADSLSQLMKTEFNAFVWWDLRNGTDTGGSFDPTIYGWRSYGDLGVVNGPTNRSPPFYAAKLMQWFVRGGDTILSATSDYLLLSAYASRHLDGSVSLLVLNKDTTTNFYAQISIAGFSPHSIATLRSYGIPQDEAARTNAAYSSQDISTTVVSGIASNFSYSFPPLSLSLLTLEPSNPQLSLLPVPRQAGGMVVLQLKGQPGIPYVLQTSTNYSSWRSVLTNVLTGSTLSLTNAVDPNDSLRLWRAAWQP